MPTADPIRRVPTPGLSALPLLLRDPVRFCLRVATRGPGIVRLNTGFMSVHIVSDPEFVRHVLVANAGNYVKGSIMDGIRLALGATGHDVIRLFLGRGLAIVAVGLAVGTIAAVAGSSALSTLLFGVDRLDLSVYGLAIATLAVVAGVAIWLPARQAAATPPGIILRS